MRTVAGFLISPMVATIAYSAGALMTYGSGPNPGSSPLTWTLGGALLMSGPFAYGYAVLMGLPVFFLLRAKGWLNFGTFAVSGFAAGIFAAFVIFYGLWPIEEFVLCGISGAAAATAFWIIAVRNRGRRPISTEENT